MVTASKLDQERFPVGQSIAYKVAKTITNNTFPDEINNNCVQKNDKKRNL
jgi:hypothetical protein